MKGSEQTQFGLSQATVAYMNIKSVNKSQVGRKYEVNDVIVVSNQALSKKKVTNVYLIFALEIPEKYPKSIHPDAYLKYDQNVAHFS